MDKITEMLSKKDFEANWKTFPNESQTPIATDAAWRRYQHVFTGPPNAPYAQPLTSKPTYSDPDAKTLQINFMTVVSSPSISAWQVIEVSGNRPPWTPTGLHLSSGQCVTTLATGRVWRNKLLDLWLGPQFGLWFKVGVDGRVFNGKSATNTFTTKEEGELYVSTQFPGQFGNPHGGRLQGPLSAYDSVEGGYCVVVLVWKVGITEDDVRGELGSFIDNEGYDESGLMMAEVVRLSNLAQQGESMPEGWSFLWFLGQSDHFTQSVDPSGSVESICCRPHGKAGIIQKSIDPPVPLNPSTILSWDWLITALPSRLREDLTISHDYLSIAVEFENGRDLTYTWSWELPVGYGYWCPLATWSDREYHIVLRSGTEELGEWFSESRNVHRDYEQYILEGNDGLVPKQIVRVWLIAGSRWQRHLGEMTVRNVGMRVGRESELQIL